jgi:hypothetical protein
MIIRQSPRYISSRAGRFISTLFILIVLSGCSVKLISNYDEETDRSVMALQRKIETFLVRLEGQDGSLQCAYDHHKTFYADAKVEVSSIHVRAAAIPQNEITTEQVMLLSQSLGSLEELHKIKAKKGPGKNCISAEEIAPLREGFNSSFISILKLELAKKRGAGR